MGVVAASETALPPQPACSARPRLLFHRDRAGWNNVRITFESLVVVANLTGRQLVLPPPSRIDHLSEALFHELQVYDAAAMGGVVDFASSAATPGEPTFLGSLPELLARHKEGALPRDVVLDPQSTRLQHFECLGLRGAAARQAAQTVLALRPAKPFWDAAHGALARAQLQEGAYHAVHLRRGDFASFRPETQWAGASLHSRVLRAFPAEEADWPLLVACAVSSEEADPFPELAMAFASRRVLRTDELYGPHDGQLHRVVVDSLLLSMAARFAGTPDSTYSTGVWHWRARSRAAHGTDVESPRTLEGPQPNAERSTGECWQRCTTFAALRPA